MSRSNRFMSAEKKIGNQIVWATLLAILLLVSVSAYSSSQIQDLLDPLTDETNEGSVAYTNAVARLKTPDTQTLQVIMREVQDIGVLERKQSFDEAGNRTFVLRKAFEIMGTNLTPLLPQLRSEFLSGNSIGASGWALIAVGADGWCVLRQGLTNVNLRVELASLESMPYVKGTNAWLALPSLRTLLTNELYVVRTQCIMAIGQTDLNPEAKIKLITHALEAETNFTVKCFAIKELEQFGNNTNVMPIIEQMKNDDNASVRNTASNVLLHIEKVN